MIAKVEHLAEIIREVGAYNRKAEYLKKTATMIVNDFGGEVPKSIEDLVKFPGVSRKTANVVLQVVFGINDGVVVDTHIGRVTQKLGFSSAKTPDKIEQNIMELIPQESWGEYARLLGAHGRKTCKSRKPDCENCGVNKLCPSAEI
jgi:endonuclease-3